jgi:hypothetical protein
MSPCETFFAFGFISTFTVALLATWFRYMPTLIALYRVIVYQWNQPGEEKYVVDDWKFCSANDGQTET